MSATRRFSLPDLGEGLTEAEIVCWLVHEGETVALNQEILGSSDEPLVEAIAHK